MELHGTLYIFGERERDIATLLDDFKNTELLLERWYLAEKPRWNTQHCNNNFFYISDPV